MGEVLDRMRHLVAQKPTGRVSAALPVESARTLLRANLLLNLCVARFLSFILQNSEIKLKILLSKFETVIDPAIVQPDEGSCDQFVTTEH